ncbi:hypothetical protein HMPREF9075_01485 [Capnocytophaga sp. oral taxon 332 str. F0381]|uniref:hypothetical protein n=1 Tax=Capnocytophaga sp. oral taxon 332 TaxID=712213 RepID=UPI0002A2DA32|nr:hypothetical protein [Capnocytophaga sp. oral taxon 332]EKY09107.1 hypothetical protein HMPREF9075_01485 [Capnocytophaga sp. oral taxon 332 str. F0381]
MEKKLKHLEFIQNAINRMANNSFIIKGWCITLAVALIALLEKEDINKCYIAFSFLPLLFFWFLDAYFIKVERQYRKLYDEVRKEEDEKIDFSMDISSYEECYRKVFFSYTLFLFYLSLIGISLVITFLIK